VNTQLTTSSRIVLRKPTVTQIVRRFPAFCGTRRFITVFTSRHWSLSWARRIQSTTSDPSSLRSILILHFHLRLGVPNSLPFRYSDQILYVFLNCSIYATCPAHLTRLDFITLIKSVWCPLRCLLQPPATSSLLSPIILLSSLFSNNLSLRYSLSVRDPRFTPIQGTGKITVFCILILKSLDRTRENKRFCNKWQQTYSNFNLLLIYSWMHLCSYENLHLIIKY
jgi:hypothetical protein